MQQSSPKLIKAGTLFAVLGLGLIGCSSGPEPGVYSQSAEAGAFRYTAVCEGVEPRPDLTLFDTLHFHRAVHSWCYRTTLPPAPSRVRWKTPPRPLCAGVRVEVHLSNGTKVSLTNPVDLDPGQAVAITLPARIQTFLLWTACPKVG